MAIQETYASPALQQLAQPMVNPQELSPRAGMVIKPNAQPAQQQATGLNALQQRQPEINPQVRSLFEQIDEDTMPLIQAVYNQIPENRISDPNAVNTAIRKVEGQIPQNQRSKWQKAKAWFGKALPYIGLVGGALAGFAAAGPVGAAGASKAAAALAAAKGAVTGLAAGAAGSSILNSPEGKAGNILSGSEGSFQKEPIFTPEQMQTLDALRRYGFNEYATKGNFRPIQDLLSEQIGLNMQNRFNFDPFRQKYERKFAEETLPGIFERFTSLGKGAQSTGAFQGMLARGGAELNEGLAALEQDYLLKNRPLDLQQQQLTQSLLGQQQAYDISKRGLGLQGTQLGTRPFYEMNYMQGDPGLYKTAMPYLAKAGAGVLGKYIENKLFPNVATSDAAPTA